MHLLVTGGAGFIGSSFVRQIFGEPLGGISHVTVIDKLTYAGNLQNLENLTSHPNFEFVLGDICQPKIINELIRGVDCVVNFAAETHVDRSIGSATEFVQTNVGGVHVLLDAIKTSGKKIRFVQVSTDEVYGSIASGSWTEEWPLRPNSPYSATKAAGELLALSYHKTHGLDVVITRCSNNYGTYHYPEKLIPLFITNLLEGKKVPVYGSGENVRDWLHVNDHCRGIHKALMKGRSGEVYNIGGGRELTNNEITSLILAAMGKDESYIKYTGDRKGHDFRYSVDCTKIKNELDYEPLVNFEDGLKDTIQWYRDNETWWKPLKASVGY